MLKTVTILILLLVIFAPDAQALECPQKLEVEISAMDFSEPGSAYAFDHQFASVSEKALKYHSAVEGYVIEVAQGTIKEPFVLNAKSHKKCEYVGQSDMRFSASIYKELQSVEPLLEGHPNVGKESLRLVIRFPIYLSRVGRQIGYKDSYIDGSMNFYIWLKESPEGLTAKAYDNIAAMLKYQVDSFKHLFFYPLGQSRLEDVSIVTPPIVSAVASLPLEN